ncbi:MAG TPA: tetratricopeptide repeat protein [Candidatus Omnitrophota bacterium]|nr:tetratricopeptide repeat protein [Candidatus Omnitrophota bacterium]
MSLKELGKWQAYNDGDKVSGAKVFKALTVKSPKDPEGYYLLGKLYYDTGNYAAAAEPLQKAAELGRPTVYLPECYAATGDCSSAALAVTKYRLVGIINESVVVCLANAGQLEKAIELQKNAINLTSSRPEGSVPLRIGNQSKDKVSGLAQQQATLSFLYYRNGRYPEATEAALKAIQLDPEVYQAYNNLGVASGMTGEYDSAIEGIKKSIEAWKGPPEFATNLAYFYFKNHNAAEAVSTYNGILWPSNSSLWRPLAYYNLGKYDDALNVISALIDNKTEGDIGVTLRVDRWLSKAPESIIEGSPHWKYCIYSIRKDSPAAKAGLKVGDVFLKIDGENMVRASFNEQEAGYAASAPTDVMNVQAKLKGPPGSQIKLKMGRVSSDQNICWFSLDKINKTLIREAPPVPERADYYGIRSLIYRAKGDLQKAGADAREAMRINPESYDARFAFALMNIDEGNDEEARKILDGLDEKALLNTRNGQGVTNCSISMTPFIADELQLKLAKAIVLARRGETEKAFELIPKEGIPDGIKPAWQDYQKLLEWSKPLVSEHLEKAKVLEQSGDSNATLSELIEILKLVKNESDREKIMAKMFEVVRQNGVPPRTEEERKYALRAEAALKTNDYEGAIAEYEKALALAPYRVDMIYNIAVVYGETGDYPAAMRHMNSYIKAEPSSADIQKAKDMITKWEYLAEKEKKK